MSLTQPCYLGWDTADLTRTWGHAAPAVGCPADGWSARWVRMVPLPAGPLRVTVSHARGARLWINAGLVLDDWNTSGTATATLTLPAGSYEVRLELRKPSGSATWALAWQTLPSPTATVTHSPPVTPTLSPTATRTPPLPPSRTPTGLPATATLPPSRTPTGLPGGGSPTPCPVAFSDVPPTAYFAAPVAQLACVGILTGYSDGTFRPSAPLTRAQAAKLLAGLFAWPPAPPPPGGTFADVAPSSVFAPFLAAAVAVGILTGYTCGSQPAEPCDSAHRPYYRPAQPLTRGQLAKLVVRASGWPLAGSSPPPFADVAPTDPLAAAIRALACRGVISGYACGAPDTPSYNKTKQIQRAGEIVSPLVAWTTDRRSIPRSPGPP